MVDISDAVTVINTGGKFNEYLFNTLRSIKRFKIKGFSYYVTDQIHSKKGLSNFNPMEN